MTSPSSTGSGGSGAPATTPDGTPSTPSAACARPGTSTRRSRTTALRTPPQRTLYLHGEDDGCIDVGLVRDAEAHLAPGSRLDVLPGAGHFLHAEDPEAVGARVLGWVT